MEKSIKSILKEKNVAYLGSICQSAKMLASFRNGTITYSLYLAPSTMSGYNTCPSSKWCKAFCLNESGRAKTNAIVEKDKGNDTTQSRINQSRIRKTRWFFEDKEIFMFVLIHELKRYKQYADKRNMEFSVRLNCTSDISILDFVYQGKNLLELFPNVQFYDYTKVHTRFDDTKGYSNYDLTYSFNGYNWAVCKKLLQEHNAKVAVVFDCELPKTFNGYKVVDGNQYDMRYLDPKGSIIGLHYHRTANDYDKQHKYHRPQTKFVVNETDNRCVWG